MNDHSTFKSLKAASAAFDGDAISRADREFLASLGDHPLAATRSTACRRRRGPITRGAPRSPTERRRREHAFRPPSNGCW